MAECFVRVRLSKAEVLALVEVTNRVQPNMISNFEGERQGLHTFMAKLDNAVKKMGAKNG